MHSNNMEDFTGKFRNELHDAYNELSGSPFESQRAALGTMTLEDGRTAEIQLLVTTDEQEFIGE